MKVKIEAILFALVIICSGLFIAYISGVDIFSRGAATGFSWFASLSLGCITYLASVDLSGFKKNDH